ncbi:hypothetical protein GGR57DRAFT_498652 [Xylariaceae sp. FL1272]|nr:hypothetical protein GGR57DRAFT_498652 [Xylariaceae sp. FL1272]
MAPPKNIWAMSQNGNQSSQTIGGYPSTPQKPTELEDNTSDFSLAPSLYSLESGGTPRIEKAVEARIIKGKARLVDQEAPKSRGPQLDDNLTSPSPVYGGSTGRRRMLAGDLSDEKSIPPIPVKSHRRPRMVNSVPSLVPGTWLKKPLSSPEPLSAANTPPKQSYASMLQSSTSAQKDDNMTPSSPSLLPRTPKKVFSLSSSRRGVAPQSKSGSITNTSRDSSPLLSKAQAKLTGKTPATQATRKSDNTGSISIAKTPVTVPHNDDVIAERLLSLQSLEQHWQVKKSQASERKESGRRKGRFLLDYAAAIESEATSLSIDLAPKSSPHESVIQPSASDAPLLNGDHGTTEQPINTDPAHFGTEKTFTQAVDSKTTAQQEPVMHFSGANHTPTEDFGHSATVQPESAAQSAGIKSAPTEAVAPKTTAKEAMLKLLGALDDEFRAQKRNKQIAQPKVVDRQKEIAQMLYGDVEKKAKTAEAGYSDSQYTFHSAPSNNTAMDMWQISLDETTLKGYPANYKGSILPDDYISKGPITDAELEGKPLVSIAHSSKLAEDHGKNITALEKSMAKNAGKLAEQRKKEPQTPVAEDDENLTAFEKNMAKGLSKLAQEDKGESKTAATNAPSEPLPEALGRRAKAALQRAYHNYEESAKSDNKLGPEHTYDPETGKVDESLLPYKNFSLNEVSEENLDHINRRLIEAADAVIALRIKNAAVEASKKEPKTK